VYFFSSSNNVIKDHKHFWHISGSLNYGCSEILSENEIAPGFPNNSNPKLGRKKANFDRKMAFLCPKWSKKSREILGRKKRISTEKWHFYDQNGRKIRQKKQRFSTEKWHFCAHNGRKN